MKQPLLGHHQIMSALLQGCSLLLVCLGIYAGGLNLGWSAPQARGGAFLCLILGNVGLALWDVVARAREMTRARVLVSLGIFVATISFLAAVYLLPQVASLFQIATPPLPVWRNAHD
jgi:P-type Ca2+ transporter type 2C